jgi:hypothetical protein
LVRVSQAALSRAEMLKKSGRQHLAGNLSVKEVRVGDGAPAQRFCVSVNLEAKVRDEIVRNNLVAYLTRR